MNKRYIKEEYEKHYESCEKLRRINLLPYDKNIELAAHWVKTEYPFAEIVKLATGRQLNTDIELESLYLTALCLGWFEIEVKGKTSKFVIAEVKE